MNKIQTLFIELTTACNLKCRHCGYKDSKAIFIETEYAKKVIDQCIPQGLTMVMFTGGEPTLHPELMQLLKYCKERGIMTKLTTNGCHLYQLAELLHSSYLDQVVISIDAFEPQTYEKIRGRDMLCDIWRDIEKFSEFRDIIHCSFLIQRTNYKELIPFLKLCSEKKIASVSLLVPHSDGDFTKTLDLKNYHEEIFLQDNDKTWFREHISAELCCLFEENRGMFHFDRKHLDAIISYVAGLDETVEVRSSVCSLPLVTAFLYADHKVRLCPYQQAWSYDNIDSLCDKLSGERMRAIFEGSRKSSLCRHCLEVAL